jgi:two-component system, chemotaxis family, protein-glutamate methylesterase/glutaminase
MSDNSIKVLIVDDSATVRQSLTKIISEEHDMEVIGAANDPFRAVEIINDTVPDVIILDIEMPKMDGLTFLKQIMSQHPIPVIICSSLADEGSDSAIKAMSYGAIDIITKPKLGTKLFLEESKVIILDSVRAASSVNLKNVPKASSLLRPTPKLDADVVLKGKHSVLTETTEKIIVVGASTGGTEALSVFLQNLPKDVPGVVIVQHMPENFTRSFAERLNDLCQIDVREAKNNDSILRGLALIAPGNYHTLVKRSGAHYYVEVKEGPLVMRHRPSVDVLFRSAANFAGKNAVGVIMTGMGDDGARGMKEMHDAGAHTIAQDEESCVVFGMPKEAIKLNGVTEILPLDLIALQAYRVSKSK